MSGIEFGQEMKKLRNSVGLSSRELSLQVGKAPAYVSQLERGLIKNPDYDTCFDLLKLLGYDVNGIDNMLQYFGIEPPELLEQRVQWAEARAEEEESKHQTNFYGRKVERLMKEVDSFKTALVNLIHNDMDTADTVIGHLLKLTEDEESFSFLCNLFDHNLARLKPETRIKILRTITENVNEDNLERFIERGNET